MVTPFLSRVAAKITLMALGLPPGPWVNILSIPFSWFLDKGVEKGIFKIDVTLYALDRAKSVREFYAVAKEEYERAIRKNLTEEQKNAVRQEYLDTTRKLVRFGNGVREPSN
jgi:hypothetical protein